jgi:hypothetical protein
MQNVYSADIKWLKPQLVIWVKKGSDGLKADTSHLTVFNLLNMKDFLRPYFQVMPGTWQQGIGRIQAEPTGTSK